MANPVLSNNRLFQPGSNSARPPIADSGQTMSVESTIVKTASLFVILLVAAGAGWLINSFALTIGAVVVGLVLGLVNSFKKEPSVPLIVAYSAVEGLAVGGLSVFFETVYPGVVIQAVLATLVTVGVVLALFSSGVIRASARATKIFIVATFSYLIFSILNIVLSVTNIIPEPFGLYSATIFGIPIGIIIGLLAVLLASYSLVLDFTYIKNGTENRIASRYEWLAGYGIVASVIWIYLEFLRIFALSRN